MFIYKVTHTPSGEYYIGISKQDRSKFNDTIDIDPMKFFNVYESNGNGRNRMAVCAKTMLAHAEELSEIEKRAAEIAKSNQSNPKFLGLKLKTKAEELESAKPKVTTKTTSAPSAPTDTQ